MKIYGIEKWKRQKRTLSSSLHGKVWLKLLLPDLWVDRVQHLLRLFSIHFFFRFSILKVGYLEMKGNTQYLLCVGGVICYYRPIQLSDAFRPNPPYPHYAYSNITTSSDLETDLMPRLNFLVKQELEHERQPLIFKKLSHCLLQQHISKLDIFDT